jgi:flagellar biosynthetic protein FlhB
MAADSAQDRTLPATPRRIQKARRDGQVPRSRELGHLAAFLVACGLLVGFAPWIIEWLGQALAAGLRFDAAQLRGTQPMVDRLGQGTWNFVWAALPLGLALALAALLAGVACGGWNFTWKALTPQFSRVDPLSGLGRLFSLQQLGMAAKAALLALVLAVIGGLFAWHAAPRFLHGLHMALPAAFSHVGQAVWAGFSLLLIALTAFAVVDVPLQRWVWLRQLRMSHQELKQELKESEGNPQIKQRLRQRMRELANRRMLAAVPTADLVVMNPDHFAVALKYDETTMRAPRVVAKGADLMAFRIRDAAQAAQVPVLRAPPLARALYAHAPLDREIPAALFAAVAQVLAWVYQLKASAARGLPPAEPPPLDVPPELDPLNPAARATPRTPA